MVRKMPSNEESDKVKEEIEELKRRFQTLKSDAVVTSSSAIENIEQKAKQAKEKLSK